MSQTNTNTTKWFSGGASLNKIACYHTDPDCKHLKERRKATDLEVEWHDLSECQYCQRDKNPSNDACDWSYQNALIGAAQDS